MAKSNAKAYVRIQSSRNIRVTMGLNCQDVTNPDAHIPDRLKINPLWPKLSVLIKQGAGWYPSEIASWSTVKALVDDGIFDSLEVMSIVSEIDDAFHIDIDPEDVTAENFNSAKNMMKMIEKYL